MVVTLSRKGKGRREDKSCFSVSTCLRGFDSTLGEEKNKKKTPMIYWTGFFFFVFVCKIIHTSLHSKQLIIYHFSVHNKYHIVHLNNKNILLTSAFSIARYVRYLPFLHKNGRPSLTLLRLLISILFHFLLFHFNYLILFPF